MNLHERQELETVLRRFGDLTTRAQLHAYEVVRGTLVLVTDRRAVPAGSVGGVSRCVVVAFWRKCDGDPVAACQSSPSLTAANEMLSTP
jgi:hypothetical protein